MTGTADTPFMSQDIRARPMMGVTVVAQDPADPSTVRLGLSGDLCPVSAPALERILDELIDDGATTVRLNLIDLDLCTSDGVGVFEHARDRLEALGGSLHLAGAQGVVRRVLDLTGMHVDQ